jgi:DNA-binding transcriptional LysR family regulator
MEAAVAGCGIAMLPELEAQRALNGGALKQVLPAWRPKPLSVYGIYLSRTTSRARCRCFSARFSSCWRKLTI